MADVETITDGAAALDRCGDLFRADPVGCNLVAASLSPSVESQVLRIHDGAETLGAAFLAGDTCVLTHFASAGTEAVLDHLSVEGPVHLMGPAGVVADVAGALSEKCDGAVADVQLSRMYRAESIVEPSKRRRGKDFVTERDRLEEAARWGVGFGKDTGLRRSHDEALAQMTRAVNEGRLIEWRSKGEVVAQLLISAARFGVVRIGQVYTPPEHRKLGHGAAFVAAVAQHQLDRQKVDTVVLTAQAANAVNNRMYRRLGFTSAFEMLDVTVVPG